jgi:hypothetical protein
MTMEPAAATCYFFCPSERRAISGGLIKALDAGIYKSAKRETKEVAQHFITARAARGRNLVTQLVIIIMKHARKQAAAGGN